MSYAVIVGQKDASEAYSVAIDGQGNTFVTGGFTGTVDFDPGPGSYTLVSSGAADYFVAKYNANGQLDWVTKEDSGFFSEGRGIAVDGSGNSYVTGMFSGTVDFLAGAGTQALVATGTMQLQPQNTMDHFVAKFDAGGSLVWVSHAGDSTSEERGQAIAVDGSGNAYVAGNFFGSADFDPGSLVVGAQASQQNHFVAKYETDGDVAWVRTAPASSTGSLMAETAEGIAVDAAGNSYVTGWFRGTVDFDPGTGGPLVSENDDFFLAKYDSAGNFQWVRTAEDLESGNEYGYGVAVDGSGGVYVTGQVEWKVDFDPGTALAVVDTEYATFFVAKYDSSGNFQWVRQGGDTTDSSSGTAIGVDSVGNSYITGRLEGTTDFDQGPGTVTLTASGGSDFFVAKFGPTGTLVWAFDTDGTSNNEELARSIAVSAGGSVFVAGQFTRTVDFDPGDGTHAFDGGSGRFFVASYTSGGDLQEESDTIAPTVSTPDLAAASDSGALDDDNLTKDATPTFTGTAETGAVVRLVIEHVEGGAADTLSAVTVTGTDWSFAADTLDAGDHLAYAWASDAAGNSTISGSLSFTVDNAVDVSAPDLAAASDLGNDTDDITSDVTPTFIGTGEIGATVTLLADTVEVGAATVDGDGKWSIDSSTLAEGSYSVSAKIVDPAGNETTSGALAVTIDLTATKPGLDLATASDGGASDSDDLTNDPTPLFEGSGGVGDTIVLLSGADTIGTTVVGGDGTWSIEADSLGDGAHTIRAEATDDLGNVAYSDDLNVTIDTAVTVSNPDLDAASDHGDSIDDITSDVTPTFTGTGEIGATVTLLADTVEVGAATVDGDGKWSIDSSALAEGTYSVSAKIVDPAGNETTSGALAVTIDLTATKPGLDLATASDGGASDSDDLTNDPTPLFEGTGGVGDTIVLLSGADTIGTTVVGGDGTWSIEADSLGDGAHTIRAEATDDLGNVADSDLLVVTIDTAAPTVSAADLDSASDSGSSDTDDLTNDQTPTFIGTGEIGAVVQLVVDRDDSLPADTLNGVTVGGDGKWSATATDTLVEGDYDVFVRIVDLAGNATMSGALGITVDTTPPGTTVDDAPSGTVAADTASFSFSSADTAAAFEVRLDGGEATIVGAEHTIGGLSEGSHRLIVRASDPAGNFDPSAETIDWSVDAAAPETSILAAPTTMSGATTAYFDFSSNEEGVSYEVSLDGEEFAAMGDPVTLTGLAEGQHTLRVRAVDGAGNRDATPAVHEWTIDTTAPAAPTITGFNDDTGELGDRLTTDGTPTLTGRAEAGAAVQLLRDGMAIDTVEADGGGDWSWTDPGAASGVHAYAARAEDGTGNDGPLSAPFQILIATSGTAGNGGDVIAGGSAASNVDGKNGDDTIFGEAGNDTLKGGNGNDLAAGGGGSDALWGGNGNDTLSGGNGSDTLYGEVGNDRLDGGEGGDRLEGGAGSDAIDGGAGADTLQGGDGSDTLWGGAGADRLSGDALGDWVVLGLEDEGDGARDTVFGTVAHLTDDTILGFETGLGGDVIAIAGLASKNGKLLDSIAITDGVLSLSKVGGGTITFEDMDGTRYTDTMLGGDGAILVFVI